jgi:hypothetical protein
VACTRVQAQKAPSVIEVVRLRRITTDLDRNDPIAIEDGINSILRDHVKIAEGQFFFPSKIHWLANCNRLPWAQEASGSNPDASTILINQF